MAKRDEVRDKLVGGLQVIAEHSIGVQPVKTPINDHVREGLSDELPEICAIAGGWRNDHTVHALFQADLYVPLFFPRILVGIAEDDAEVVLSGFVLDTAGDSRPKWIGDIGDKQSYCMGTA